MEQNEPNFDFDQESVQNQSAEQPYDREPLYQQPENKKSGKIVTAVFAGVVTVIAFVSGLVIGRSTGSTAKASSSRAESSYSSSSKSDSSYSGGSYSGSSYSGSSYSGNSYSSGEMSHSTYCLVYMDITDVKVKHERNYTYVSGKVTNNGTYSIKYVKVKATCKDYSGNVIDTDWTYAVDSTWLEPGESKAFQMMIRDEYGEIKTATVTFTE